MKDEGLEPKMGETVCRYAPTDAELDFARMLRSMAERIEMGMLIPEFAAERVLHGVTFVSVRVTSGSSGCPVKLGPAGG